MGSSLEMTCTPKACHGYFGPVKKVVWRTIIPGKNGLPEPFSPEKFGPDLE